MISSERLVVYLNAAAAEALGERELSGRSRWAIQHTISELTTYRDAVRGTGSQRTLGFTLSVIPSADPHQAEQRIAELFLEQGIRDGDDNVLKEEKAVVDHLDRAIAALQGLNEGDSEAAERVLEVVSD